MRMMIGKMHPYNRSMFRGMERALSFLAGQPFPTTMADKVNEKSQNYLTKPGDDVGQEAENSGGPKEGNPVAPIKTELKTSSAPAMPMTAEEAEEKRLREIDEIAQAINDDDLVCEAKYGDIHKGIFPSSASEIALKAAQKKAKDITYRDIDVGVAAVKQSIRRNK